MTYLLFVLAPIALLDSTSMMPLSIVPIALILASRSPFGGATGFLLGIMLTYFGSGVLLLYGLDALLEHMEPELMRWWNNPCVAELLLQIIVGVSMLVFARKIGRSQGKPKEQGIQSGLSPSRWFTFGAAITLGGMPGAIPYLGAIDQIIRAELPDGLAISALVFYNLLFIAPLAFLFLLPRLFPEKSDAFFAKLSEFFENYGPPALAGVLALLGLVFIVDAVTFYLGYPLFPVVETGTLH